MKRLDVRRILLSVGAPIAALLVAVILTSSCSSRSATPVRDVWITMLSKPKPRQITNIVNGAIVLYLSRSPSPSASG